MPDVSVLRSVYSPADVANYTMEVVEARSATRGIALRSGIGTLDRHMKPLLPGELVFVLAFTSHGKTAFLQSWVRYIVGALRSRESTDLAAVYCTWETLVEELGLYDLCNITGLDASAAWYGDMTPGDLLLLRSAAMRRAIMPLWVIGRSLKRRRQGQPLTVERVNEMLRVVESEQGVKPAVIFVDYLQLVEPSNPRDDKRLQVMHTVDMLRQLGRDNAAPVVVACQAGRQVLERGFKLPEIGDAQESSRVEQDADKVISLWYPCKTEPMGDTIKEVGLAVTDQLLVCGIRKQRHAASGQVFPLRFLAATNDIRSWDEPVEPIDFYGGRE